MSEGLLGSGLQIGQADIDREHREIADFLRDWRAELTPAEAAGQSESAAKAAAFRKRLAAHFEHEESIMAAAGFPAAGEHRSFHRSILERIDAILDDGTANGFSRETLDTLIRLFINDIVPEDMGFKSFLQD